jgi:AraC family transcriptional regulator, positive regulator of tynA and feaB
MLPSRIGLLDASAERQLVEHTLDLIALSWTGETSRGMNTTTAARARAILNLKSAIEAHLFDTSLRPEGVAAAARMSVRYANVLLAEEGTPVERYIWARRLERSRKALADSRQDHRSISEIAYSHGFSSQSHFTRRFKEMYGATPSEYRQRRRD